MVFAGIYEHTIDLKNRLAIPSEFRARIQEEASDRPERPLCLYATYGGRGILSLFSERDFEQRAREINNSKMPAEQLLVYQRLMFGLSARVEIDKQGRILIPDNLLQRTGVGREVVLVGSNDHIEIHNRETWNANFDRLVDENQHILGDPKKVLNPS